jgi:hypothetical protein
MPATYIIAIKLVAAYNPIIFLNFKTTHRQKYDHTTIHTHKIKCKTSIKTGIHNRIQAKTKKVKLA